MLFAHLFTNLMIVSEGKHCASSVSLQVSRGYFCCKWMVALAEALHAILRQRLTVIALLVICCKMYTH